MAANVAAELDSDDDNSSGSSVGMPVSAFPSQRPARASPRAARTRTVLASSGPAAAARPRPGRPRRAPPAFPRRRREVRETTYETHERAAHTQNADAPPPQTLEDQEDAPPPAQPAAAAGGGGGGGARAEPRGKEEPQGHAEAGDEGRARRRARDGQEEQEHLVRDRPPRRVQERDVGHVRRLRRGEDRRFECPGAAAGGVAVPGRAGEHGLRGRGRGRAADDPRGGRRRRPGRERVGAQGRRARHVPGVLLAVQGRQGAPRTTATS